MTPEDQFAQVPDELKALDRWIVWKYLRPKKPGGKRRKCPWDPLGACGLDATRIDAGLPFAEAVAAYRAAKPGSLAGLGVILGNGIGGVDCDNCYDPATEKVDAIGRAQLRAFRGAYIEVSPSGRGFKGLFRFDPTRIGIVGRKVGQEELYSGKRWFAVTGSPLRGYETDALSDRTDAFLAMAKRLGARNVTNADDVLTEAPNSGDVFLRWHRSDITLKQATEWLYSRDPDLDQPDWFLRYMCAWALQFGWDGFEVFDDWSSRGNKYPDSGTAEVRKEYDRAMRMNARLTALDKPFTIASLRFDVDGVKPKKGDLVKVEAGAVLRADVPEVHVLIDGLLTAGLALISGQPKIGKSWLILKILLDCAAHQKVWDRRTSVKRSLYLALEDNTRRMKSRLRKLGATADPNFQIVFEAPRVGEGLVEKLRSEVSSNGYDLIVIDTLAKVRPQDGGKSSSVWNTDYENVQQLKKLADDLNVAIVVITHNSKAGSNGFAAQNAIAATGGLMAGVDGWWVIERTGKATADDEPLYKLTVEHRDVEGGEFAMIFDRERATWEMLGEYNEQALGELQRQVVEALQRAGKAGMTLQSLVNATGSKPNNLSNCLARLRKRGNVLTDAASVNRLAMG